MVDEDDEREDVERLLHFCTVQKNLLQTHGSIQELSCDHDDVTEDNNTHKNQELVRKLKKKTFVLTEKYVVLDNTVTHAKK